MIIIVLNFYNHFLIYKGNSLISAKESINAVWNIQIDTRGGKLKMTNYVRQSLGLSPIAPPAPITKDDNLNQNVLTGVVISAFIGVAVLYIVALKVLSIYFYILFSLSLSLAI